MQKASFSIPKLKGKNILLLTHENADLDSLASAAMMHIYLKSKKIKSTLAVPSHINEQALHFAYENKISFMLQPNLAEYDAVMLFDLNDFHQLGLLSSQMRGLCNNRCQEIMVFDHHEPKKESISCASKSFKAFTSTSAVSTTHLLYSILGKDKSFNPKMAFFACVGMIEDTGRFLVGSADSFRAFSDCLSRSKKTYAEILSFAKHIIPEAERVAFLKAAQRAEIIDINDIIVVSSNLSFYQSSAATKLLEFGAQITLVCGSERGGVTTLAARAESAFKEKYNFNLMRDLMLPLQDKLGGNPGGHSGAAIWKGSADEKIVMEEALLLVKAFIIVKGV